MPRTRFELLALTTLLGAGACAPDGVLGDDDAGRDIEALPALLATAPALTVDPAQSVVALHASLDRGDRTDEADVTLLVERGDATVTGEGDELVVELSLTFGQVALPSDVAPGDLRLIDIAATSMLPLRCTASWTSDIAWCGGTLDVLLDWSLAEGDEVYPLGSQPLRGLEVDVAAILTDEALVLQLAGDTEGTIWSWAGVAELSDLSLRVTATAPAP